MTQSDALKVRREFGGERLRIAREFKGWTKEELARRTDLTGASIGQFERSETTPNAATVKTLASALEVPLAYFSTGVDTGYQAGAYFRSLRSTTLRERKRARAFVQWVHQFVLALEHVVVLPENSLPRHPIEPTSEDPEAIEAIAAKVRKELEIALDEPVPNVVRTLERGGVVAVLNDSADVKIDAFSVPFDDRAFVVMSSAKGKHDRSRFDAAHELGHLVMHEPSGDTKTREAQAHRFAAAFLMPKESIINELPAFADWRHLLQMKQRWGTSIAALLRRSHDLNKMDATTYRNAMKSLSARGWRRDEPGNLRPEEPSLLKKAVEVAHQEGHSISDLARSAALPEAFVDRLLKTGVDTRPSVEI